MLTRKKELIRSTSEWELMLSINPTNNKIAEKNQSAKDNGNEYNNKKSKGLLITLRSKEKCIY